MKLSYLLAAALCVVKGIPLVGGISVTFSECTTTKSAKINRLILII